MRMTLGHVVATARKNARMSLKELAQRVKKDDGQPVSPQYLNDIEHDRRTPSDFVLVKLAAALKLEADYLHHLAGTLPADLKGRQLTEEKVVEAYKAFRKTLKH